MITAEHWKCLRSDCPDRLPYEMANMSTTMRPPICYTCGEAMSRVPSTPRLVVSAPQIDARVLPPPAILPPSNGTRDDIGRAVMSHLGAKSGHVRTGGPFEVVVEVVLQVHDPAHTNLILHEIRALAERASAAGTFVTLIWSVE